MKNTTAQFERRVMSGKLQSSNSPLMKETDMHLHVITPQEVIRGKACELHTSVWRNDDGDCRRYIMSQHPSISLIKYNNGKGANEGTDTERYVG